MVSYSASIFTSVYTFTKFIQNTVGHYIITYTKLHTCTINTHTYQDSIELNISHKKSKLHYFTSLHALYKQSMNYHKV